MPKIRKSPSINKSAEGLSAAMSHWLNAIDPVDLWPTCFTCRNLANDNRTCSLFKAQPPVNVVVKGCDKYSDIDPEVGSIEDDIPF